MITWRILLEYQFNITLYLQVVLLEEVWSELFVLNAIQWSLPLSSCPLLSPSAHAHALSHVHKAAQSAHDIRQLAEVAAAFREHAVDPAEFAYLKAIVLFRPGETVCKLLIVNL